jgi:carboxyl-terminal processing protease
VFIPLDTIPRNSYLDIISRKNLLRRFALQFTDQHRTALNNLQTMDELTAYFSQYAFDQLFRRYAADNAAVATDAQWEKYHGIIDAHLRAYIGRNTPLEEDALYALSAPVDDAMQAAVKVFE